MSDSRAARGYGAFRVGDLKLALPMAALREVVPRGALMPLPCRCEVVVGGVELRGVVVPVLDLCRVLGRSAMDGADPCVIVMVHAGRILGLLADGVSGVFAGGELRAGVGLAGGDVSMFDGCIEADDGSMVSVLSPAAIAALPQVPMVSDPEAGRSAVASDAEPAATAVSDAVAAVPMMLMRSGPMALAIEAIAVHATLADPVVRPSALARGACRGVIGYAGVEVPVVDLLAFCHLGELPRDGLHQAFVISLPVGQVAFLIDRVVDIVDTRPGSVIGLPSFALPRAALFAGVLPQPGGADVSPYFVIDGAALAACEEVVAWGRFGVPAGPPARVAGTDAAGAGASPRAEQSMLTYDLGVETATPLSQVSEILAYTPSQTMFDGHGSLLSVLVNRGRSIPVMCLARLAGGRPLESTQGASVLVVESEGELVGFVVPALKGIEPARWQPELPAHASGRSRPLALVGQGAAERMLPVLDLWKMARALRQGGPAGAH